MIALADVESWFAARGWHIADFQRQAWQAMARGESGLIHSSTGSGKTLAAWFGALLSSDDESGLHLLWITPMRALAADTAASLQQSAAELGSRWRVELRTGDTGSAARQRQRRQMPQALVTTPESLSLLLSYADLIPQLRRVETVIVDEWHELLGGKRGVQTELALSRLRALSPGLRSWGLSATLGNLDEAASVLLGVAAKPARIIAGLADKAVRIDTLIPPRVDRFAWAGHLGLSQLPRVLQAIESARSSLLFANTRSQAERWYEALRQARPDWPLALHHASLDGALRREVEQGLKEGALRAVVATSSLDLGVDFSPVDQVLQIGGPKGVARLLQRAGRSGHQPGGVSRIVCVPTQALELAEFAAAREAAQQGRIEARRPLRNSLDVLAQHVVTLALTGQLGADEMRAQIATTQAYAELSDAEWQWVLDFVMHGGSALAAYPQYRKVVARDGRLHVDDDTLARRHRMSIGTIVSDGMVRVRFVRGPSLGSVEESFVSRLKPGDAFTFAGRRLSLIRVRDMTAYVRAHSGAATTVRWMGGRMPLSSELASTLEAMLAAPPSTPEFDALQPLLELQRRWSRLPAPGRLLIERARSREGQHWFVYPMAGRHVHEGLSALLAWRLSRLQPLTCGFAVNDYGFELVAKQLPSLDESALRELLSPQHIEQDLPASLNASEMARRRFREIARIAGLVFEGYPGSGKTTRQIQASSGLIYDVLERYDAGNLLTRQALREALEQQLDYRRLAETLLRLQQAAFDVVDVERFTPLAFPLWADRLNSHQVSSEGLHERVARMLGELEAAADEDASPRRRQARA